MINKTESNFLANVSHEIRTPMNAIVGIVNVLSGMNPTKEQQKYLAMLKNASDSLLRIVNDILDFSKIDAGNLELEISDFDLKKLVEDTNNLLLNTFHIKEIKFSSKINDEVPCNLRGDTVRLSQIILNLETNALKFTKKGFVNLEISLISETLTHANLKFAVKDSGIGIPKDKIGYLFKSFSRLETPIHRQSEGTGLGLAISRRLVQFMGGSIGVESEEKKGSTFWFAIEFEKQRLENLKAENDDNKFGKIEVKNKLKVLLVEDNLLNQEVALGILKDFDIQIANHGIEALEILKKEKFDLILMDVNMPKMDGIEATKIIRDINSEVLNHEIPIIALTAFAMKDDKERCIEAGMNNYVSKPIDTQILFGIIEDIFNGVVFENKKEEKNIFDKDLFLKSISYSDEFAVKIIDVFLNSPKGYVQCLANIKKAIEEKNIKAVIDSAHFFKGMLGYLSTECRNTAFEIEKMAREGNLEKAYEYNNILIEEVELLICDLKQFLEEKGMGA